MNIWIRRFLWLFAAYSLQRLLFFAFNHASLQTVGMWTLFQAICDGARFDLCAIATINVPIIAAQLLLETAANRPRFPALRSRVADLFSLAFALANVPLIVFGIVDSRLYGFTGRRISPETFAISGDIKAQSWSVLAQYWYLTLPGAAFLLVFLWQTRQRRSESFTVSVPPSRKEVAKFWLFAVIAFVAVRGGWQTKPLAPAHAYQWQPAPLSNLVLNSSITLLRSASGSAPKRVNDFQSMDQVKEVLRGGSAPTSTIPLAMGKNFVVIIVESLASEYTGFNNTGKGYTPFLDSLAKNSVVFRDTFANGRRSIDAMPAIFAGVPAWRNEPFITSPYATNNIHPLPRLMREAGYRSLFFHGAANGSMHFDVFSRIAGFDEYIGKNEYPYKGDDDGQWGIYDGPFLKYSLEKLSTTQQPFLAGIFTLTSHNPFKVPPSEQGKFPKGTLPVHESIGYADKSLETFFKLASGEPWFHNTIFIITGDHTSLSDQEQFNNMPGRFRVPIMFFDPSGALPRIESAKIASHVDILPTILELSGVVHPGDSFFGGPLFDRNWRGRFVQEEYDTWYLRDQSGQVRVTPEGKALFYAATDDKWQSPANHPDSELHERQLQELKAMRQYFVNGMIDNTWY